MRAVQSCCLEASCKLAFVPAVSVVQAEPLGGGQLLGAGRLWVSPAAELDPRAVRIHMEGRGLPTEAIVTRYLPKVPEARCSVTHLLLSSSAITKQQASLVSCSEVCKHHVVMKSVTRSS